MAPIQLSCNCLPFKKPVENPCLRKLILWCRFFKKHILRYIIIAREYFVEIINYEMLRYAQIAMEYVEKNGEYKSELMHNAIIITPSRGMKSVYYAYGPEILIKFFMDNSIPYKVYVPSSLSEFEKILRNKSASALWLFGHGSIGSFAITQDDIAIYKSYMSEEWKSCKKIAIHQLHCNVKNRLSPNSLSHILVPHWDFHESGYNDLATIRAYVEYVLANIDKFPGIWKSAEN